MRPLAEILGALAAATESESQSTIDVVVAMREQLIEYGRQEGDYLPDPEVLFGEQFGITLESDLADISKAAKELGIEGPELTLVLLDDRVPMCRVGRDASGSYLLLSRALLSYINNSIADLLILTYTEVEGDALERHHDRLRSSEFSPKAILCSLLRAADTYRMEGGVYPFDPDRFLYNPSLFVATALLARRFVLGHEYAHLLLGHGFEQFSQRFAGTRLAELHWSCKQYQASPYFVSLADVARKSVRERIDDSRYLAVVMPGALSQDFRLNIEFFEEMEADYWSTRFLLQTTNDYSLTTTQRTFMREDLARGIIFLLRGLSYLEGMSGRGSPLLPNCNFRLETCFINLFQFAHMLNEPTMQIGSKANYEHVFDLQNPIDELTGPKGFFGNEALFLAEHPEFREVAANWRDYVCTKGSAFDYQFQ